MHRPPLPPGMFLVHIFTRGWVDPRAMVQSEGNMSLKNLVTPPGIDPGSIWLVAQHLNHYTTPDPQCNNVIKDFHLPGVAAFQRKMSPSCSVVQGPHFMKLELFEMIVTCSFKMLVTTYLVMQRDIPGYRNAWSHCCDHPPTCVLMIYCIFVTGVPHYNMYCQTAHCPVLLEIVFGCKLFC